MDTWLGIPGQHQAQAVVWEGRTVGVLFQGTDMIVIYDTVIQVCMHIYYWNLFIKKTLGSRF
jgi:hypothetical protein